MSSELEEVHRLLDENKMLKEALRFYADKEKYYKMESRPIKRTARPVVVRRAGKIEQTVMQWDSGEIARRALGEA